ncbi:hypothetical protein J437_LFUL008115 [Ladona fulva]|uniref:Endonuclease/exonuclease/phosphatase domain-containing protein n=1 Tax=Ladona fulva TaxID=123851 RepID=A0A8K0KGB0_LADFU|nr:hypothetical protein J437_LFUL008115 [Ladona fulva]
MYGYCPGWALQWDYRKKGILNEIRHYAADIISLQEVETDQFHNFFLPELKADGYDGIFSPKSRAKTMSENERKYVDGCAIFYRRAKFSLEKEYLVEFNQLAMARADGSDDMLNRVMPKDNIGLAALLRTNDIAWENGLPVDSSGQVVPQRILVCTAHIHWDPEYCDVKLIQTMMLSHELRVILDEIAESHPGYRMLMHKPKQDNVHLLLCGDFNSLPDSGVVEFLTTGRVSADHPDFKELLGYKSCLKKISPCDRPNEYTHSFKLASAYSSDGIIDYIFYPRSTMTPLGLLGPLANDWFRENKNKPTDIKQNKAKENKAAKESHGKEFSMHLLRAESFQIGEESLHMKHLEPGKEPFISSFSRLYQDIQYPLVSQYATFMLIVYRFKLQI